MTGAGGQKSTGDHSGFQETARIEQHAGLVIMMRRPDRLKDDGLERNLPGNCLIINVAKNRFGPTGETDLLMDLRSGAITGTVTGGDWQP